MSISLQKLNIIRLVEDEYFKAKLIAKGFVEIILEEAEEVKEIIKKKPKGKE